MRQIPSPLSRRPRRSTCGRQAGFTLVEVLVALAIVGIAMAAVARAAATITQNTGMLRDRSLAMISAENQLSEALLRVTVLKTGSLVVPCPQGGLPLACEQIVQRVEGGASRITINAFVPDGGRGNTRLATTSVVVPAMPGAPR